ncbi:hypothetical protein APA_1647 [Pseudanabaena sp. lw0831]|nr:hypothetical protein APA_1647 [Pseudanabaena sp. lw0831]
MLTQEIAIATSILDLYQNTKWCSHFVFLKPLLDLIFNPQK